MEPIRVVLVDDHPLLREGLGQLLGSFSDIALVGYAADGEDAPAVCRRSRPDVVLMDLRLPGIDGIEATRRVLAQDPAIRVIILTTSAGPLQADRARAAGAVGVFTKDEPPGVLIDAIRAAAPSLAG